MPKAEKNYGVSLLKAIMCFEVVCCHFLDSSAIPLWQYPFSMLKTSAVPIFMMLSFLLCRGSVTGGDTGALKNRCRRLLWPQIGWALVYYLVCSLLKLLEGGGVVGLDALLWQLATGSSEQLNSAMWFQTDLIILTVVISLLFVWRRDWLSYGILLGLGAVCLWLQYNGMNFALFEPLRPELKFSIGRIVEVWPFAAVGICLFSPGFLKKIKEHWLLGCSGGLLICVVSLIVKKPCTLYDSFGYAGLHILLGAVGMVVLFYSLPLEKLGSRVLKIIDALSRFTLGTYCMHMLLAKILYPVFTRLGLPTMGLGHCVLLFVLTYLVSWGMSRTGNKRLIGLVR